MKIFGFTIIRTKALERLKYELLDAKRNDFRCPVTKRFISKDEYMRLYGKPKVIDKQH